MKYEEKLINMSAYSLAETAQHSALGEELYVEVHDEASIDTQQIGFAIARVDFLDSEVYLIGGCGFHTMSVSANGGVETEELAKVIEAWLAHQDFEGYYLKIRLEIRVE